MLITDQHRYHTVLYRVPMEQLSGCSMLAVLSVIMIGRLLDALVFAVAGILLGFTGGMSTRLPSREIPCAS